MRRRGQALLRGLLLLALVAWSIVSIAPRADAQVIDGGHLAPGQAVTATADAGDDVRYAFTGISGSHVSFDVGGSTWTFGVVLRILGPDGRERTSCLYSNYGYPCGLLLDADGEWSVVVDPLDPEWGALYFVYGPERFDGTVTRGVTTSTAFFIHGQSVRWAFAGTRGEHVTLDVTTMPAGDGTHFVDLRVISPTGRTATVCPELDWVSYCELTLDATGTWTIVANPVEFALGTFAFTLAGDVTGRLTPGKPLRTEIAHRGQSAIYTFAGTAGTHVSFDFTDVDWHRDGDVVVSFRSPTGRRVGPLCDVDGSTFCDFTPDATGVWTVLVDTLGETVGHHVMTYAPDRDEGALVSNRLHTSRNTIRGQNAQATFSAVRGAVVSFAVVAADLAGGSAGLRIQAPDGTQAAVCTVRAAPTTCRVRTSVGGRWRLVVDPEEATVGSVEYLPRFGKGPVT